MTDVDLWITVDQLYGFSGSLGLKATMLRSSLPDEIDP